jgi:hypothetical protein
VADEKPPQTEGVGLEIVEPEASTGPELGAPEAPRATKAAPADQIVFVRPPPV